MKASGPGFVRRAAIALGIGMLLASIGLGLYRAGAAAPPIPKGTVMVGTGNGFYSEFKQDGTFITQLDTKSGAREETGCGFDPLTGDFYTTNFAANSVSHFDPTGAFISLFGSGYNADPESIVFDGATPESVYVGQADGNHHILKFDISGNLTDTFAPTTDQRGTDWIDLSNDRCTMFYCSEGHNVQRFDVCTNTQLTNFNTASLPGANAYAHRRLLPSQFGAGGVLVADTQFVVRLDATGADVQHYTIPDTGLLFALNLDPDGTSFWTGDLSTGFVTKVDIKSGAILQHWNANVAPNFLDVAGVCVKGELIAVPTPTPTSAITATASPKPTPTPSPRPTSPPTPIVASADITGPAPISVSGSAGQTVKAGTFTLTNTSASATETFTTITLGLSKPALFSSLDLTASFGTSSSTGTSSSPAASTVITMSPPIVLSPGAKANFALDATLSSATTIAAGPGGTGLVQFASVAPRAMDGSGKTPLALGLSLLMLSVVVPGSRRRRLLATIVLLAALGATQISCDSGNGGGPHFVSLMSSVTVTAADGTDQSGNAVPVTGVPTKLSTVTRPVLFGDP